MAAAEVGAEPLHAQAEAGRFSWRFGGFVILSLAAHLATFFLFGVRYPQRVTIPPPAPAVSLLLPTTPENRALLRRIEAADAALVSAAPSVTPAELAEVHYRPSYETVRTQPRAFVEPPLPVQFPPPRDPLAIIRSLQVSNAPVTAAPPPQPTRIALSAALQQRLVTQHPAWKLSLHPAAPLDPAVFLVGVTDRGELRYSFLQRSSGDPQVDSQIATQLLQLSFQHAPASLAWGMATLTFGDEAYPPVAAP